MPLWKSNEKCQPIQPENRKETQFWPSNAHQNLYNMKTERKHMYDLIMTSYWLVMTVNDLEMKTSKLCLYADKIKAGNPYNLKIGSKHKVDHM